MLPEIYRIKVFGDGFLAVMAKPVGDWLDDEIYGLGQLGVGLVVSLLTWPEIAELGLKRESDICKIHGIEFISFPIADRCVPDNFEAVHELVKRIHSFAKGGKGAVIHCRAGIGRSGLIAGSVLVHHGMQSSEAFKLISNARRVVVPDTDEQAEWVRAHEVELKNS